MGSTRFPGKSLAPLAGRPSLGHLLDAVSQCAPREATVVATSTNPRDDSIAAFAASCGVGVVRGSESDVASRFLEAVRRWTPQFVARLNADSPLLDYRVLHDALRLAVPGIDLVSTVLGDRFPHGMHVEVINAASLVRTYAEFDDPAHFEHVTRFYYEHADRFRLVPVRGGIERPQRYRFVFDTAEDAQRLEALLTALGGPHYTFDLAEKCRVYERLFGS